MKKLVLPMRGQEWWGYKLPPLFGACYLVIALHDVPLRDSWQNMVLLLVWMIGAAGFGYYSNDVSDIHEDALVGKENAAAGHTVLIRGLILSGFAAMTLLPWFFSDRDQTVFWMVGIHLLLFLVYAMPPFRLKHRGWMGIVADAFYAHSVPVSIVLIAMWPPENGVSLLHGLVLAALLLWQTVLGIRSIIEHQVVCYDQDRKVNSSNFVQQVGFQKATGLLRSVLPTTEVVALSLFIALLSRELPLLGLLAAIIIVLMYFGKPFGEGVLAYHPMNTLILNRSLSQIQEMVMPLVFLLGTCLNHAAYLSVAALHIIVFLPGHMQLIDLGRDHVAKPVYYKGVLGVYYTSKSGANISFQTLVKLYANTIRPIYFGWKKLILWFYYKGLWNLYRLIKWLFYQTVVWFFYNVPYRFASWGWHIVFYLKNGYWHPDFRGKAEEDTSK